MKYINAKGSFVDKNTIKAVDAKGKETIVRGSNIVIAVGGRPRYPEVKAITLFIVYLTNYSWRTM